MNNKNEEFLKFIGETTKKELRKINIDSKEKILRLFPKSYDDFNITNDNDIFIAEITTNPQTSFFRIPKTSFKAIINHKNYNVIIFRRAYLSKTLLIGDRVLLKGSIKKNIFVASEIKPINKKNILEPRYKLKGIKDHVLRKAFNFYFDLDKNKQKLMNVYDEKVLEKGYYSYYNSLKAIHMPKNQDDLEKGLLSMKVYESIEFLLKVNKIKSVKKRPPYKFSIDSLKKHLDSLPFLLSNEQIKAVEDCIMDLNSDKSLNRLIQGDVGSGKTIVAFLTSLLFLKNNYKVALMAPTQILAEQHYENFRNLFNEKVVLVTGNNKDKSKLDLLNSNKPLLIIGTHILSKSNLDIKNLGLVIVDEQHKFGVNQRKKLVDKSLFKDLLYLSATPIPRSIVNIVYSNANVSNISYRIGSRKKVTSRSLGFEVLDKVLDQLETALKNNQHVFVVVPSIFSTRTKNNIYSLYSHFKTRFNEHLLVVHGQMDKTEQNSIFRKFKNSEKGILLSTNIIEVGIDIPSATFMVVIDANYFGLAQLHQLRGRIGRGNYKGVFYMVSENPELERLKILESLSNGFEISKLDLKLRGPGSFFGEFQTGHLREGLIDLSSDLSIIQEAQDILSDVLWYNYVWEVNMIHLSVDGMGGDNAPKEICQGVMKALHEYKNIKITIFGNEKLMNPYLEKNDRLDIFHCEDYLAMDEKDVLKKYKENKELSMFKAMSFVKEGKADAFVSAGPTQAIILGGHFIIKRMKYMKRVAIAPIIPSYDGRGRFMLDGGANTELKPEHLEDFALFASIVAEKIYNRKNPKVAMINIGTEKNKGRDLEKNTIKLLEMNPNINFYGNIEPKEMFTSDADIFLTDGFTGNIVMKTMEGSIKGMGMVLKREIYSKLSSKLGAVLIKKAMKSTKKALDASEIGGAIIMGFEKIVIKAHGSSDAHAFKNALRQAKEMNELSILSIVEKNMRSIKEQ